MLTSTNPTREECEFLVHLVEFLESYADMHFRFEEGCMESYRCPAHQKNKQAHEQFRASIQEFKQQYHAEGFRIEVLKQLHEWAAAWIKDHILQVDVQLRPCAQKLKN